MKDKTISILGSGWLGKPLAEHFIKNDYKVKVSTTSKNKLNELASAGIEAYLLDIDNTTSESKQFFESDYLVICITSKSVHGFQNLINFVEGSTIDNVIFISSTSVYKKVNKTITEDSLTDLSTSPLIEIEKLFIQNKSFRTTVLRFAGLFGYERNPANFFRHGKIVSDPEGFVNLIHRDDCTKIIEQIIEQNIWEEIFNCCTDSHPTKREFYTKTAIDMGKLPPKFDENGCSDYKIISNEKLAKQLNYSFIHNDLMNLPKNI